MKNYSEMLRRGRPSQLRKFFPLFALLVAGAVPYSAAAQEDQASGAEAQIEERAEDEPAVATPDRIEVWPAARDEEIAARLRQILLASRWFTDPQVNVDHGVVVLSGQAAEDDHRLWAGNVARRTEGVVAVVNRIGILPRPLWDFSPAAKTLREFAFDAVALAPLLLIAMVLFAATIFATKSTIVAAEKALTGRTRSALLAQVASRAVAVPVFLLGLYVILRVSGLTNLALTVVGGTGLFGIIIGIAFRDIAENFLASILLSTQHPFRKGDLIEVSGMKGFVQRVTTRGTVLMTLQGNHIQVPNSTIYKREVINFTANPNIRVDFPVGIDYSSSIARAQAVALNVLEEHSAVLSDPEPLVLADGLGEATVNLRVYAWINGREHSDFKVKSALIRLVKNAFDANGIKMPSAAQEIIVPRGVTVHAQDPNERRPKDDVRDGSTHAEDRSVTTLSEGGLAAETEEIREQALLSTFPVNQGPDLLGGS